MKIAVLLYIAFQFCYAKRQIFKICPGLSPDLNCGKFNISSIWRFQGNHFRRCDNFHWCKIRAIQEVSADSLAWKNQKIQRGCFQANEKTIKSSRSNIFQNWICNSLWNHKYEWTYCHKCFPNPDSLLISKIDLSTQ